MTESKYSNFDYELSKKILNLLKVRITFNFKLVLKMHDISFSLKEYNFSVIYFLNNTSMICTVYNRCIELQEILEKCSWPIHPKYKINAK